MMARGVVATVAASTMLVLAFTHPPTPMPELEEARDQLETLAADSDAADFGAIEIDRAYQALVSAERLYADGEARELVLRQIADVYRHLADAELVIAARREGRGSPQVVAAKPSGSAAAERTRPGQFSYL